MKIDRILLIAPPVLTLNYYRDITPSPPLGLGYLASVAEKIGIEVKIIDFLMQGWGREEDAGGGLVRIGSSYSEIGDAIREFKPDLLGISCQFSRQNRVYQEVLSLAKRISPGCVTVAGGAHVTVCPEEILKNPACDYILIGEAENSFKNLILGLKENNQISLIDGLGFKYDGKLNINEKKEWISDLDSIEFPAHHLMRLDRYFGLKKSHGERHKARFCPIVTSRGCPAQCSFCNAKKAWGDRYRFRSTDNILSEMRKIKNEYNIEELMFEDDNITVNPERARELFSRMAQENLGFIWDTPNGVGAWTIDEEMIRLMKGSGCIRLNFPIESGSQRVIDRVIKKPVNLLKVKKLIDYCKKIKLDYGIFLVIGMPGESIADIWKSFRFAADRGCFVPNISVATPYPGTELFDICLRKGYFTREFSLDDLFVRSFMIKTPEWDDGQLRSVMFWGEVYLKFRNFLWHPVSFLKEFIIYIRNPVSLFSYFKKYTYRKK